MLKWVFGADISPFKRGLNEMRQETKAFSGSVKGMLFGAFGGAAVAAWAKNMVDHLGRVQDLADKLGMSAESVQKIGESAKLSGSDMETAVKAVGKLTRSIVEAKGGSEGMNDALAVLGLTASELGNMAPEQQLIALARGYENCGDKAKAYTAIVQLMGRSGDSIMTMLAQGSGKLAEAIDGASFASNSAAKAVADLGDQIDKLKGMSAPAFGAVAQGLLAIGAYAGSVAYAIGTGFSMIFRGIAGDFKSLEQFKQEFANNKEAVNHAFTQRWNEIYGKPQAPGDETPDPATMGGTDPEEAAGNAKEIEKERTALAEKRQKIEADIAKLQEEARQRGLNLDEKIADAENRRAAASDKARTPIASTGTEADKAEAAQGVLEATKQKLEIEKEIADLRKDKADAVAKSKEEAKNARDEITSAEAKLKEKEHQYALDKMSPEERVKALQADKAASDKTAADLDPKDKKGAAEERMRGLDIQKEIDSERQSIDKDRLGKIEDITSEIDRLGKVSPVIATSSLASIGAGGSANLLPSTSTEKQTGLLQQIRDLLAQGNEHTKPVSKPQEY